MAGSMCYGKGGGSAVVKQTGKIKTPFAKALADSGPAKGGAKRGSSKGGSKR